MVDECRVVGHLRPDDGEYLVDDLVLDIVEYEQSRPALLFLSLVIPFDLLVAPDRGHGHHVQQGLDVQVTELRDVRPGFDRSARTALVRGDAD